MSVFGPPTCTPPWLAAASSNAFAGLGGLGSPANLLAACLTPPPPSLLSGPPLLAANPPHAWWYVRRRFTRLLVNLTITDGQRQDGETKQAGIRACLNRHYCGGAFETANSMLIGSWGKNTRGRPSRDIDILFLLPAKVYWRFQARVGNRQSQLLQEVRSVLAQTYPQTTMRADGQVVVVPFNTIPIEVSLGFVCADGRTIIVCDTHDEGGYKISTAHAEATDLNISDMTRNGNTRSLIRMIKSWQREKNVPIKSFHLERLAIEYLDRWTYSHYDVFYYDWMVRDFLEYLISRANGYLVMPGTSEIVELGSGWLSRAQTAYRHAVDACNNERDNYEALAGGGWREIFGSAVPVLVS